MNSTFEDLRALHKLIGTSLDFIERRFADATRIPDLDDDGLGLYEDAGQYGVGEARRLYRNEARGGDDDRPTSQHPFEMKMRDNLSIAYASPPPSPFTYTSDEPVTPPGNGSRSRLSPSITRQHSSPNVHATPRHKANSSRIDLTSYTQSSPSLLLPRAAPPELPHHHHNESISTDSMTTEPSLYSQPSQPASPVTPASPFSPMSPVDGANGFGLLDFPSLNAPLDPGSPAERMVQEADIVDAISRIAGACGQISATVQLPFLTLCDASMAYHLPSCLRLFEAAHIPEILREAGEEGMEISDISSRCGVEVHKLAHILRLLATHHLLLEVRPNTFANNRISSMIDSGKPWRELVAMSNAETKYEGKEGGIAAFVGMCTDELFKASSYMTEAFLLSPNETTTHGREPEYAPFTFAFGLCGGEDNYCRGSAVFSGDGRKKGNSKVVQEKIPFFPWLEGHGLDATEGTNPNKFRFARFAKAMEGTTSWETPGAVLQAFDWNLLDPGSLVVDVGGGIGSTTDTLVTASENCGWGLRFVLQDREVVIERAEQYWKKNWPGRLRTGAVTLQVHDFFKPQIVKAPAVYLLRVILHDWSEVFARKILLQLRESAGTHTTLLCGDFILPLACPDSFGVSGSHPGVDVEGAVLSHAPAPLLSNMGKASANAFNMDLTMQCTFNSQERTLRETFALMESAGWKITRLNKCPGSWFFWIVAVPTDVPIPRLGRSGSRSTFGGSVFPETSVAGDGDLDDMLRREELELIGRASSRCGTPTFGSRVDFPSLAPKGPMSRLSKGIFGKGGAAMRKFGFGKPTAGTALGGRSSSIATLKEPVIISPPKKKKPSPLTLSSPIAPSSPAPSSRLTQTARVRGLSISQPTSSSSSPAPSQQGPLTPASPRFPSMLRRSSHAHLTGHHAAAAASMVSLRHAPEKRHARNPSLTSTIMSEAPEVPPSPARTAKTVTRRGSFATLSDQISSIISRTTGSGTPESPRSPTLLRKSVSRRSSLANLTPPKRDEVVPPLPTTINISGPIMVNGIPTPSSPVTVRNLSTSPSPPSPLASRPRKSSVSHLTLTPKFKIGGRKRSESIMSTNVPAGASLLGNGGRLDFGKLVGEVDEGGLPPSPRAGALLEAPPLLGAAPTLDAPPPVFGRERKSSFGADQTLWSGD
ncbi:ich1-like protein [Schizophyllum fasciatum]